MPTQRRMANGSLLSATALALILTGCATSAPPPAPADPLAGVPESIANVFRNANEICGPITGGAKNPATEAQIQHFRSLLSKSATGAAMLKRGESFAEKGGNRPLWICFEKMKDKFPPYAYYSWGRGVLVINTHMYDEPIPEGKQISAAIHELRHAEQDTEFQAIRYGSLEESRSTTYASEADAEAINLLVQWEMKEAGYTVPWDMRKEPSSFIQGDFCFSGLYQAFSDAVKNGGSPADATRAVFRAWHDNKPILYSYQGQGNMRWGMQQARDELKNKWALEDQKRLQEQKRRHNTANANADEQGEAITLMGRTFYKHTQKTCNQPRTPLEAALPLPVPSAAFSEKLDRLGILPDGSGNYLQAGGGVRNILRHDTKDAAKLRP